jgi:hypothetical protein
MRISKLTDQSEQTYRANDFTIVIPQAWQDKTIHMIMGPVEDGVQHNILITREDDLTFESASEYADWQIAMYEDQLKQFRLLKREDISLNNGIPACRAIFCWCPSEEVRLYQEQLFVLMGETGYNLTTSFTKRTRKTLGPQVERAMLSFQPNNDESTEK